MEGFEMIDLLPTENIIPCRDDQRHLACISRDCNCEALSLEMFAKLPEEVRKPSHATSSN